MVISSFRPLVGGAEVATARLGLALSEAGADVVVVTRAQPNAPRREAFGAVRVIRVGLPVRGKLGSLAFGIGSLAALFGPLRRYRIVHVQNIDTPLLVGVLSKLLSSRRLVVTLHGERMIAPKRETWWGRRRLGLTRRFSDALTALTPVVEAELRAIGIPAERIHRIPNGVDVEAFRRPSEHERRVARARLDLPESGAVSVFVGRLIELKGLDDLLDAWALLPIESRGTLILVGDGEAGSAARGRVRSQSLGDVRFPGMLSDVRSYLQAADIFVLPSRQEGLSVALLEAMAAGLAVIVSDLPGNRAVVQDAENGLVVPVRAPKTLATTWERLLKDCSTRRYLGANASRTVTEGYSLREAARRQLAVYGHLLESE